MDSTGESSSLHFKLEANESDLFFCWWIIINQSTYIWIAIVTTVFICLLLQLFSISSLRLWTWYCICRVWGSEVLVCAPCVKTYWLCLLLVRQLNVWSQLVPVSFIAYLVPPGVHIVSGSFTIDNTTFMTSIFCFWMLLISVAYWRACGYVFGFNNLLSTF